MQHPTSVHRCLYLIPVLLCLLGPAFASPPPKTVSSPEALPIEQIDVAALTVELQKLHSTQNHMYLVFWVPKQLLLATASLQGMHHDSEDMQEAMSLLDKYTLVLAMKLSHKNAQPASESELRDSLVLIDGAGDRHNAFADMDMDVRSQNLLIELGKIINDAESGGRGELHVFAFPAKDKSGQRIADALATGKITFGIDGSRVEYRLPLSSLLQPQYDPASEESFPGSYRFNPYTGALLQPKPTAKKTKQ